MLSRRSFLATSATLPLAARRLLATGTPAGAGRRSPTRIFIGTGTHGAGQGILTATWDGTTGQIGAMTLAAEVDSPTFLATHQRADGTVLLYSISEASGAAAQVTAFIADAATGTLRVLNHVSSGGDGPAHVSVSPDGGTVLAANYGGGSVSSFKVQPDGSVSEAASHFQYTGSGPYRGRQDASHAHSAVCSPDGKYVLVNDLGLDRIALYHLDAHTAVLTPNTPANWGSRAGVGPRHIAWSRDGHTVYSSNELDSTVDTLAWREGAQANLQLLQTRSSLPAGFAPRKAFVGEIVTAADGRTVYAGNRVADDTIAIFDITRRSGMLSPARFAPSGGKNCRHITLDPGDRWMVISHQDSNDLTVLQRDGNSGALSAPHGRYPVNKPMCVVFV